MENAMLALRLEKELEDRIARIAAAKGSNKSTVVREAVMRYLEDHEDARQRSARARRVARPGRSLRKALGLDR